MVKPLAVGDEAPDFDLASTEDVVLMLRDEVPRTPVLLYFAHDLAAAAVLADLQALAARQRELAAAGAKALVVSPAKVETLKAVQRDLDLPFPLLSDDRAFSVHYGVPPAAEGIPPPRALFVVGREQRILWRANPLGSAEEVLGDILALLRKQPSPVQNYPRSVINRLVDRWVN